MNKLFFILLLLALAAYGQIQERIAIINTLDDRDSIGFSELTYLTDMLREAAVNVLPRDRFGVMTTESIIAFLGSMENTVKACKESSCLAELGKKVSADYVAQGRIGRFGGGNLTLKVELYNVKTGNLMGSFTGNFKDIYSSLALINEKAPDLFKKMLAEPEAQKPEQSIEIATTTAPQPAPSADPVTTASIIANIQVLIQKGLNKNKEIIQKASFPLSPSNKTALYEKNRKTVAGSVGHAVLNVLPGFGVGSFSQRDLKFGLILLGSDVLNLNYFLYRINDSEDLEDLSSSLSIAISIAIVSRIVGVVVPFIYPSKYNKTLKEALSINENISYSIDPLIIPKPGPPAVGLAFNLRY
ncbi:MAG: P13 family porin [Fibromonadaceae bacterium]|jgi:hypothetical protein|nr:P13 family porin [Fibromonadaceae bacterium]